MDLDKLDSNLHRVGEQHRAPDATVCSLHRVGPGTVIEIKQIIPKKTSTNNEIDPLMIDEEGYLYSKTEKAPAVPVLKRWYLCCSKWTRQHADTIKTLVVLLLTPIQQWWKLFIVKPFKTLSNEFQEKVLFCLSTVLGTGLFFVLFECLYRISLYNLEQPESAFVLSYAGSYLISIVWQHGLNRYFVFPSAPYCQSLFHTYLIYSFSFAIMTVTGTFLITHYRIKPRLVTIGTLPVSGLFNYYFLSQCLGNMPVGEKKHASEKKTKAKKKSVLYQNPNV